MWTKLLSFYCHIISVVNWNSRHSCPKTWHHISLFFWRFVKPFLRRRQILYFPHWWYNLSRLMFPSWWIKLFYFSLISLLVVSCRLFCKLLQFINFLLRLQFLLFLQPFLRRKPCKRIFLRYRWRLLPHPLWSDEILHLDFDKRKLQDFVNHWSFISVLFHKGTDEFLKISRVCCGYRVDCALDYLVY